MLKSGGWGGVVAYEIIVSAQGPNTSSFFCRDLGVCWDKGLDLHLDQGLTI